MKTRWIFWAVFLLGLLAAIRWIHSLRSFDPYAVRVSSEPAKSRTPEERNALWLGLRSEMMQAGPRNEDKAPVIEKIKQLALTGEPRAQQYLGALYEQGLGVERDSSEALRWYSMAKQNGFTDGPNATAILNTMHPSAPPPDPGMSVSEDMANQGDAASQNALGWMYSKGLGVPQDLEKARLWYQKSADQGDATGESQVARLYGNVAPIDRARSVEWYQKAAAQNHAAAESALGWDYLNGEGVAKNIDEARRWYQKAADQGDGTGQYQLGWMCEKMAPVDYACAMKWYQLARAQGNSIAMNNIGYFYENGLGVSIDYAQAFNYYSEAANHDDPRGEYHLGALYAQGAGVAPNDLLARQWMEKASAQGDRDAQAWLANHK